MSKGELHPAMQTLGRLPREDFDAILQYIEADRAAVREQAERETVEKIVAWLRSDKIVLSMDGSAEDVVASAIEAGEWKP